MRTPLVLVLGAALAIGLAAPAWAHVEIDPAEVPADTSSQVDVVVEHGCGTSPISKVVTRLPPEAVDVSATAPEGWTVTIAGAVVTWDGAARPVAEDLHLTLEFTPRAAVGTVLGFPTIESCPNGQEVRWIEDVPDSDSESVKPLPRVVVVAAPVTATTATAAPPAAPPAATTTAAAPTTPAVTTAPTAAPTSTAPTSTPPTSTPPTTTRVPTTTVAGDGGGVDSTGGVLAGFGAAAVVVLGAGVIFLRNRKRGSDAG
jgi:periplasmic copper chaperone A